MNKLKGYRVMSGFSQKDIAAYLGISRVYYTFKENGKVPFTETEKEKILLLISNQVPKNQIKNLFQIKRENITKFGD